MNFNSATLEQLKTLYNANLSRARELSNSARLLREEIERRKPSYHGRSVGYLADAERSLYMARTFADTPHDLPGDANPYRPVAVPSA